MAGNDLRGKITLDVSSAVSKLGELGKAYRKLASDAKREISTITTAQRNHASDFSKKETAKRNAMKTTQKLARSHARELARLNNTADPTKRAGGAGGQAKAMMPDYANNAKVPSGTAYGPLTQAMSGTTKQANALATASRGAMKAGQQAAKSTKTQRTATTELGKAYGGAAVGMNSARYALYDISRGLRIVGTAMVAAGAAPIAMAIKYEDAFAQVQRTVSGLAAHEMEYLRQQMIGITQVMPIAFSEVARIGTLAGQMGIASQNIAGFVKTVAQFAATTDVSVETASTAFGRMNALLPDVKGDFLGMADSVSKVGVNAVATEAEILNTAIQISAVAGQAGLASTEIIGFAGSLASVAVRPELARGIVTRVFGRISRAVSESGAKLVGFAKLAGMTSNEFKRTWGDPKLGKDTVLKLFDGIRRKGNDAEATLRELGITSVRDVPVLLRLANAMSSAGVQGGLMAENFLDSAEAAGEMQRQYDIVATTVGAKMTLLGNNISAALDTIGRTDLGFIGDVLDNITKEIKIFTSSLTDGAKIFGIEIGKTNAEVLGMGAMVAILAGAAVLFLSVVAQIAAGLHAFATIKGAMGPMVATVKGAATKVVGGLTAIRTAIATTTTASYASITASGRMGRAFGTVKAGAIGAAAGVRTLGAGIKALALAHPILTALTVAFGLFAANEAMMGSMTTTVDEFSKAIERTGSLGAAFRTSVYTSDGFFGMGVKSSLPFQDMKKFNDSLELMSNNDMFSDMTRKMPWQQWSDEMAGQINFDQMSDGLDLLDDSIVQLFEQGDDWAAVEQLQQFAKEAGLTDSALSSMTQRTEQTTAAIKNLLSSEGFAPTEENVIKVWNNEIPEFISRTLDAKAALRELENEGKIFNAMGEDVTEFVDTTGKRLASMIDLSGAYGEAVSNANNKAKESWQAQVDEIKRAEDATEITAEAAKSQLDELGDHIDVSTASLSEYFAVLEEQAQAQADFAKNIALAYIEGGQEAADAVRDAGPEIAALIGEELANGVTEGMDLLVDYAGQGSIEAMMVVLEQITDSTPEIRAAFQTMGEESKIAIVEKIVAGDAEIKDILTAAKPKIIIDADADPAMRENQKAANYIDAYIDSKPIITVGGNADPAISEADRAANYIRGLQPTMYVQVRVEEVVSRNMQPEGHPMGPDYSWAGANGGMHSYADGGFATGIYKGRKGSIHKFAEPETGWEAYVSGKPGQEKRNRSILMDAAERLGMQTFAKGGVTNNSGHYAPSASSRSASTSRVSVVELSAYDRKLLAQAGNVSLSIGNEQVARANSRANAVSAKRGSY